MLTRWLQVVKTVRGTHSVGNVKVNFDLRDVKTFCAAHFKIPGGTAVDLYVAGVVRSFRYRLHSR